MFFGRERELKLLMSLLDKRVASLVVIRGRRRIGKSTLVEEFAKRADLPFFSFQGLSPTAKTTEQSEREVFVKQMEKQGRKNFSEIPAGGATLASLQSILG